MSAGRPTFVHPSEVQDLREAFRALELVVLALTEKLDQLYDHVHDEYRPGE